MAQNQHLRSGSPSGTKSLLATKTLSPRSMLHVERVMNEGTARRNSARLASSAGAGHPGLDRIRWTFRGRSRSADEVEIDEQQAALAALGADDGKVESWLLEAIQNDEERERERLAHEELHGGRAILDQGARTLEADGRELLEQIAVAIRTLARAASVSQTAAALASDVLPPRAPTEARRYAIPDEEPESESLPVGTGLDAITDVDATPNPRPRVQDFEDDAQSEAQPPRCVIDPENVLLAAVSKMDGVEQALLDIGQYAAAVRDEIASSRTRATAAAEAASDAAIEVADLRGALQSLRDVAIRSDEENDRVIAELQETVGKERDARRAWEAAAMTWRTLLQLQPEVEPSSAPVPDGPLASLVAEAFKRKDVLVAELSDRAGILISAHAVLAVDVAALETDLVSLDETLGGQMHDADAAAAESSALEGKCSELKAELAASMRKVAELDAALQDAAVEANEAVNARDDAIDRADAADDRIAELEDEVARLTRALGRSHRADAPVATKPAGVSCDLLLPPGCVSAWAAWRLQLDRVPNSAALVSRFALTVLPTANQTAEPAGFPLQPLLGELEASMSGSLSASAGSGTFRSGRSITMEVSVLSGELLFFAAQSGSPRSPRRQVFFDSVISVTREGLTGLKIVSSDAGTIQGQLQSPLLREIAYEVCHLVFSMSGRRHVHAPSLGAPSGGDRFRTVFDTSGRECHEQLCTTHSTGRDGGVTSVSETHEVRSLGELNVAAKVASDHGGDALVGVAASRHAFQETAVLVACAESATAAASLVDPADADVFLLFVERGACDVGYELRRDARSKECAVVATIDAVPGCCSGAGVAVIAAGADEVAAISDVSMEATDDYVIVTFAFHETLFACCAATTALERNSTLLCSLLAADHAFVLLNDIGVDSPVAIEPVTFGAMNALCVPVGRLMCSTSASDGSAWSTRLSRRRVKAVGSQVAACVLSVPARRVSCRLFENTDPAATTVPKQNKVDLTLSSPTLAAVLDASNVQSLARGSGQTAWVVDAQVRDEDANHMSIVLGSATQAAPTGLHDVYVLGLFDRDVRDRLRMIIRVRPLPQGATDLTALVLLNDSTPAWSAVDGGVVTCAVTHCT